MARILNTADLEPGNRYKGKMLTQNESEWVYNGLDCTVTLEVLGQIKPQLDNTTSNTYQFSKDLMGPILEMQQRGVLIDQKQRAVVLESFRKQLKNVEAQLYEITASGIGMMDYNWRSNKQTMRLFYHVLGLPPIRKRNANGVLAPTVNRDALERLSQYFLAEPLVNRILLLRDLDKKRMFLETGLDPDGRIRTNFNIAGTNTGRLASALSDFGTGGNLQNVDRELRSVFIADPGKIFINADLEQADSRNLGATCWTHFVHEHGEKWAGSYLDACESGDLHTRVSMMARPHLPWTSDMKENRKIADQKYHRGDSFRDLDKKLGHGTNYVGQPPTMAKHSHVALSEVTIFQENYFKAFPCIPKYHDYVRQEIQNSAVLTTLLGRRRRFFGLNFPGYGKEMFEATIREAVAYCPQSMTADEIDTGLLRLFNEHFVELLLQVHDSILLQCWEHEVEAVAAKVKKLLEVHIPLVRGRDFFVPVELKVGWNWRDRYTDKEGKVHNEDGLVKWTGSLGRRRTESKQLTLQDFL